MQGRHIANNARISTKGWSLNSLTSSSRNFRPVDRVSASSSELFQVIKDHERAGLPLVIEGFHKHESWPTKMFTIEGFEECSESSDISVRDVHSWTDKVMNFSDFVLQSRSISSFAEEGETERLYGKDAECPHAWEKWLQEGTVLPTSVLSHGTADEFRFRPASSRIETLMCYLGIGDTYTPCHKDLCASSGQNLMCYTEDNGSSFWFMTESSSAPQASTYFHHLGQELDHENHVITLEQLGRAPFNVYILEQRLGDLVLVPPRSCHQVVNYGGITLKTSWSRITLTGLSTAYHHELPIYRRVGRPETYRIKSTIYYALTSRTKELQIRSQIPRSSPGDSFPQALVNAINSSTNHQTSGTRTLDPELHSLAVDLAGLLKVYDIILAEEKPGVWLKSSQQLDTFFNDDNRIVCDFCECDIFQSFFECGTCTGGSSSSLIVCPGCYSEGRSCRCQTMEPMQCRTFQILIDARNEAADFLGRFFGKQGGNDTQLFNRHERNPPRLFQAGCLLLRARKDNKRTTRSCSRISNQYDNHEVPFTWGLHCLQCHRSTCFEHILKHYKMHSAEAILLFEVDGNRMHYHQKHLASNARYVNNLFDVERKQKEGTPTEGLVMFAHIALQYGQCIPSNSKSLRHGWYDPVQIPRYSNRSIPPESEDNVNGQTKLTITIPGRKRRFSPGEPQGGRTQAYVEVPPAPYSVLRKRSNHEAELSEEETHPPSSVPHNVSPSTTQGPKTRPPSQRRAVEQNSDSPPSFKGGGNFSSTRLSNSSSPLVVTGKKVPGSPQQAKRGQCEPLSPHKYLEGRASKRDVYHRLQFRKKNCPTPDDDSSSMILTPNVPVESVDPISPPQGDSYHPPAQFVPPQAEFANSARQLFELINAIDMPRNSEEHISTM